MRNKEKKKYKIYISNLKQIMNLIKWARGDSNPRPPGYQPDALAPEPRALKIYDYLSFIKVFLN